jgi:RNA polymerase sigma-70 factor (ECF subfamily)
LAEDVFIKAFAKMDGVKDPDAFEGWLYQVSRNRVIDYYRQKKTTVALEDVENTLEYETNVIDSVNLDQQQKKLLKLIKELGAEQQVVIKLKFYEDLTNQEIAALLKKSEGAIRVIQHRALARLQELMESLKQDE